MGATSDPTALLREAEAYYGAHRPAEARPVLERLLAMVPGHPAVLHLYGLILSQLGELSEALKSLRAAHAAAPGDPHVSNNLGNLLRKMGDPATALTAYDEALDAAPGFAPALLHRAMTLRDLGRADEARAAFVALEQLGPLSVSARLAMAAMERDADNLPAAAAHLDDVLAADPGNAAARRGRARFAWDMGEPDALARYRDALADTPGDRDLLLGYLSAADTAETREDAKARVAAALAADPVWIEGQDGLFEARREDGEDGQQWDGFEMAVAARPRDARLWAAYVGAASRAEAFETAAALCDRAEAATRDPHFGAAVFSFLSAAGDVGGADARLTGLHSDLVTPLALAKHRFRQGRAEEAEALLKVVTDAGPDDIEGWALRGIAWQLLGDKRFDWLNGQDGLVSVADLGLSPLEIASAAARLRQFHRAAAERVGQSVRGGTQTPNNLFTRTEPEVQRLREAIGDAVERHRAGMPEADPTHPVLRHRDAKLGFAGAWSVRLTDGGFHVQHMHPRGIFSAASWWAVPPVREGDEAQAGWLEIGGAPAYLGLDLEPFRRIEPKIGQLALFPSTLHHGTRKFATGERMSVAFDVVPRR